MVYEYKSIRDNTTKTLLKNNRSFIIYIVVLLIWVKTKTNTGSIRKLRTHIPIVASIRQQRM